MSLWEKIKAWVLSKVVIVTLGRSHERLLAYFQVRGLLYIVTDYRIYIWNPDRGTLEEWNRL